MEMYAVPALLALAAITLQARWNARADRALTITIVLAIVLIAGLRWFADVDYDLYLEMFGDNPILREFTPESISALYGEPGYLLVSAVFKSLGSDFVALAFTCALLSMSLKGVVVSRYAAWPSLALTLYLCLHFVTIEFIQMRWAVATGFIALAYSEQQRGRRWTAIACHVGAIAFHYFSLAYLLLAALVGRKGYRRYFVLFGVTLASAFLLKAEYLERLLVLDSDIYILSRIARYAAEPESALGFFSFAKLAMYPLLYAACVWWRPDAAWKTDEKNLFLLRVSLLLLSFTLFVTFIPVLHFRATVLADLFAIVWVLNALDRALEGTPRTVAVIGLGALFIIWYSLDVRNYHAAGRLTDYQTWLTQRP